MKLSHIILKVKNLDDAVKEYRDKGFVVEYGKSKNPYNALIYFSEGPYVELLASTGMPGIIKFLMRLFGKGSMIDRLEKLDNSEIGYCELALENYKDNLSEEMAILKKHGIGSVSMPSHRLDTHGRDLRFQIAMPDVLNVPFMMTYFSEDPKPKNFVHPNGIQRVKKVIYKTDVNRFDVIRELCDDEGLELAEGKGIEVEFE
ncbi:MAG: VOC family protein [Peptostreptococcaceae bacterium]|nr:VOC family protein [Peptostreptococcaceae bacterium]